MSPSDIDKCVEHVNQRTTADSWSIHYGVHAKSITSRDSTVVHGKNSLQECIDYINEKSSFLSTLGYYIWYADAVPPGGTHKRDKVSIHNGTPCA